MGPRPGCPWVISGGPTGSYSAGGSGTKKYERPIAMPSRKIKFDSGKVKGECPLSEKELNRLVAARNKYDDAKDEKSQRKAKKKYNKILKKLKKKHKSLKNCNKRRIK